MNRNKLKKEIKTELLYRSLIGLQIHVRYHSDPSLVNIAGIIKDETKNIIVIQTDETKLLRVSKTYGTFEIYFNNSTILIEGSLLVGNPKSRIKKRFRNW